MVTDNLVDTKTLSKRLMVSKAVLEKNRVRRMGIPFVRLSPRCVRYAESDISCWLQSRKSTGSAQESTTTSK
jgi:hypothetical protein